MGILRSILRVFTWWDGQTLNTQLFTWRKGVKVGEDAQGNIYYTNKDGSRRWVIFNGEAEASRVSPDWHGWLHHTFQEPPSKTPFAAQAVGKATSGKPDRHGACLCAAGVDPPLASSRAERLRGMAAGVVRAWRKAPQKFWLAAWFWPRLWDLSSMPGN